MMFEHQSKNKTLLLIIAVVLLLGGFGFFLMGGEPSSLEESEQSSEEASLTEGWVSITEPGISYQAPQSLSKKYFSALDWPPQSQVTEGTLTCTEAGQKTERAGETEIRTIAGVDYCVTSVVEGAAGNVYTQYAYAFQKGDTIVTLTFSTRQIQCGNYDEEEMILCEEERQAVNLDELIHQIASSVTLGGLP
jgi:hypothetical protein